MVLPTVLKKRHSLKGKKLLQLIKRIKNGNPDSVKEFARVTKDQKTDDLEMEEICTLYSQITGENIREILDLAGRDNSSILEARWALHCTILFANEVGQPQGQDLATGSNGTATPDASSGEPPQKKKRDTENGDLVDKIASKVEESAKAEVVTDLKEKVRTLCLQSDPSVPLILLTLEELARMARRINHEDCDIFEELTRQANRYQTKLNIPTFCLSVLGGKAADAVSKAMSKCLKHSDDKAEKGDKKGGTNNEEKRFEQSPLSNLYPTYQVPFMHHSAPAPNFGMPGIYHPAGMAYGNPQNNYRYSRPSGYRSFGFRPRGPCLFCESPSHQIKDCIKMKAAKGK